MYLVYIVATVAAVLILVIIVVVVIAIVLSKSRTDVKKRTSEAKRTINSLNININGQGLTA